MATAHQQVQNKYRARTPSLLRASSGGADLLPYWGYARHVWRLLFRLSPNTPSRNGFRNVWETLGN
jgi:hypothetical protein